MSPSPDQIPSQLRPLAEGLLENRYARETLQEGAEKAREAYERSRKRRVKPSKDRRLRRQIEAAVAALDEGTAALASGRTKPKRTGRKVVLVLIGGAVAGAGVVIATNEELRAKVLGSAKALGDEIGGSDPADEEGGTADSGSPKGGSTDGSASTWSPS